MAEQPSTVNWQALEVGDRLPALHLPPLTRVQLAVYCGASGDHNPVHVDSDFAREAGLGDVIAHGMLIMAWMGRCLTDQVEQARIRGFETRFTAMTRVGDAITCEAGGGETPGGGRTASAPRPACLRSARRGQDPRMGGGRHHPGLSLSGRCSASRGMRVTKSGV